MGVLEEPVSISDRAGKLIFISEAAVALVGAESRRELLESEADGPKFGIYDETDALIARDRFPWELDRGFGGGSAGSSIRCTGRSSGCGSARRHRGADGRPIYTVSAFEDVTEMKLAEFAGVFTSIAEMLQHRDRSGGSRSSSSTSSSRVSPMPAQCWCRPPMEH